MSWKIYALGNAGTAKQIVNLAGPKLQTLGYTVSASGSDYSGYIYITVDGVQHYCQCFVKDTGSAPVFLCVNDETDSIVICKNEATFNTSAVCNVLALELLHGTDVSTGEAGLFTIKDARYSPNSITNMWTPVDGVDTIFLHRVMFRKNTSYNDYNFVTDDLYWGSICISPGAVITVGADGFVCLNHCLYAKL